MMNDYKPLVHIKTRETVDSFGDIHHSEAVSKVFYGSVSKMEELNEVDRRAKIQSTHLCLTDAIDFDFAPEDKVNNCTVTRVDILGNLAYIYLYCLGEDFDFDYINTLDGGD